jgi:hypothetical protein
LRQLTEAERRDFSALTISRKAPLYDTGIPSPGESRRPFSGKPEEIAGDIRASSAMSVHELIFADIPRIPGCCRPGSPVRTSWATIDRASHVQQAGEPASLHYA